MPFKGVLGGVRVSGRSDDRKMEGMYVIQVDLSMLRDSRRIYQIRIDQVGKIGGYMRLYEIRRHWGRASWSPLTRCMGLPNGDRKISVATE